MRIVATISFEQFNESILAMRKKYQRQNKRRRWSNVVFVVVASLTFAIVIQKSSAEFVGLSMVLLLLLIVLGVWSKWRAGYCLKQAYEVQKKQLNGQVMDIEDSGISGRWENGDASYQYKWSAFEDFLDLPNAFLLLPNSASFVRIPKASLSPEEQQTIRRWATTIEDTRHQPTRSPHTRTL